MVSPGPSEPTARYAARMKTIELTDEELRLVWNAVHAFLDDFGHEEADILAALKALLAKLQTVAE